MRSFHQALFGLLYVLSSSSPALAQFECVAKSGDKVLRWSSQWQSDKQDAGVSYHIFSVEPIHQRSGNVALKLDLRAIDPAKKQQRIFTISRTQQFLDVCREVRDPLADLPIKDAQSLEERAWKFSSGSKVGNYGTARATIWSASSGPDTPFSELPFIAFTDEGWLLSEAPSQGSIIECRVLERRFRCLETDVLQHQSALLQLEEELKENPEQ